MTFCTLRTHRENDLNLSALLMSYRTAADIDSDAKNGKEGSKSKNISSSTATTINPQSGVLVKAGTTMATSKATTAGKRFFDKLHFVNL